MKITIKRKTKDGGMTYRRWTVEELIEEMNSHRYDSVIINYRSNYTLLQRELPEIRKNSVDRILADLPMACFSKEESQKLGEVQVHAYNPLVLLTIHNLRTEAYAAELRDRAAQLPYTRLAFVGVCGHSLNVVCQVENVSKVTNDDSVEVCKSLLLRGQQQLRKVYGDHLHVSFDVADEPENNSCYLSIDKNLYHNPISIAFPVDLNAPSMLGAMDGECPMPWQVENRDERHEWRRIYIDNFRKAQNACYNAADRPFQTLLLLARYCHETGMPQALAESFALLHGEYADDPVLVRDTFSVEYEKELHNVSRERHLNTTALLMRRTSSFLNTHFRFRKNVLNGIVEYRTNDGVDFDYHLLTPEVQNSMTIMALESGLNSWDKDMNRYLHSNRVPEYDPVNTYLEGLPEWDGKDRVTELARRVPTKTRNWEYYFHIWMLSMVAQWKGMDDDHGNAIAPILIGAQATGKTSFCRILLPEELMEYYNDSIHFKDDKSVMLALTSFALINIDEFDSLSRTQQPLLKYLLSKTDVKYRAAYRNHIEQHKRYCSFIGTTNSLHPLSDPTGSRRFVCVKVASMVDFKTSVDHAQLYAQLVYELNNGERYWLTKEEADELTLQNTVFQRDVDLSVIIPTVITKPQNEDETELMTIDDVVGAIKAEYPDITFPARPNTVVGRALTALGYELVRTHSSRLYKVART